MYHATKAIMVNIKAFYGKKRIYSFFDWPFKNPLWYYFLPKIAYNCMVLECPKLCLSNVWSLICFPSSTIVFLTIHDLFDWYYKNNTIKHEYGTSTKMDSLIWKHLIVKSNNESNVTCSRQDIAWPWNLFVCANSLQNHNLSCEKDLL